MKENQITASMAKDIAFKLGAVLNDEEAEIFADGYNAALLKVNKNASTELPNYANLSTSSQAAPDDSVLLPCPFCGSPAEHYPDGDMEGYIIMCGNKNGDCNLQAFGFTTPEEAEKAWNTRAAMLQGGQPVSNHDELALYYLQGQKDGLEWAAQLAEANHPNTGDWLYDDPMDLAKAIRKGPDMPEFAGSSPVTQDGWISCSERMPDNDESKPIAIFTGKCLGQGMFVATYDDDGFFDYWEGMEIIGVSHWMPLPEPPQK